MTARTNSSGNSSVVFMDASLPVCHLSVKPGQLQGGIPVVAKVVFREPEAQARANGRSTSLALRAHALHVRAQERECTATPGLASRRVLNAQIIGHPRSGKSFQVWKVWKKTDGSGNSWLRLEKNELCVFQSSRSGMTRPRFSARFETRRDGWRSVVVCKTGARHASHFSG